MTPSIVLYSTKCYDREFFDKYNNGKCKFTFIDDAISPTNIVNCDFVCVFVHDEVNAAVVKELKNKNVKAVLSRCAGYDKIDLKACQEAGIVTARVPAYSPYAVAEHAATLLMSVNRRIKRATACALKGNFTIDKNVGMDIYGKTVGVLGTGKIGQIFIDIMIGFGAKIVCFDVFVNETYKAKPEVTYMTQEEVLQKADIISLHLPLLASTKHVIRKENIDKMKDGVFIINPSRGGLVNTKDLLDALDSGKVRGAGLDVYEHEDGIFFNDVSKTGEHLKDPELKRLIEHEKVVLTAHQAFLTDEALVAISTTTINSALAIMENKECPNVYTS